jgi:hypothetical protein
LTRGDENEDVGGGWLRRLQGYRITKAAASGWWEKARKESEEAYLLKRVIPPKPTNADRVFVNPHLLRVIAAKYPKNVPALYRTVLDERPDLDSASLAETLARCRAPAKDTLDLLSSAASNSPMEHRLPALFALKDVDKKQFDKLLLATIQGFPTDIRGKYWLSREAGIASLAIEVEDSRVWTTLEKVAKRSAVGLRMELLHSFGDSRELRWRVERLRLLASFLDDLELRDQETDVRFGGPCAGFLYPRVEVRDFAAEALSSLLGIELELKLDRTPTEWAKVRADVQTALNRELANGK